MSAGGPSIGGTLTGGIQDISALLPLLGTDQCEAHVVSGLTRGFIYVAATPISIFGSIGMVKAGVKAIIASISIRSWNIVGTQKLRDMGFEPKGEDLAFVALDADQLAKTHLDPLLDELHIEKADNIVVATHCFWWNFKLICLTAAACVVSLAPYIYLNIRGGSNLRLSVRWAFPIVKAIGGFLTATILQIIIQRRSKITLHKCLFVATLGLQIPRLGQDRHWLTHKALELRLWGLQKHLDTLLHQADLEGGYDVDFLRGIKRKLVAARSGLIWPFLALLLIGNIAVVVGYVGCFSVVQSSARPSGPISWLCLEAFLSIVRMSLWAWNPMGDEGPPLTISFTLKAEPPLPARITFSDETKKKLLSLTPARSFLEDVTAYGGFVKKFDNPNLHLYYTFTYDDSSNNVPLRWVLYITYSQPTGATKVFSKHGDVYTLSAAKPPFPTHSGLMTEVGDELDRKDVKSVTKDQGLLDKLIQHHESVLSSLRDKGAKCQENIAISWTMKTVQPESECMSSFHDYDMVGLTQGRLEQLKQFLTEILGERTKKDMAQMRNADAKYSGDISEEEMEMLLIDECEGMEHILFAEVRAWEYELARARRQMVKVVWDRERRATSWGRKEAEQSAPEARRRESALGHQLVGDWRRRVQARLSKDMDAVLRRLKSQKDQSETAMAKIDVDRKHVRRRWGEILRTAREKWKKLMGEVTQEGAAVEGVPGSWGDPRIWLEHYLQERADAMEARLAPVSSLGEDEMRKLIGDVYGTIYARLSVKLDGSEARLAHGLLRCDEEYKSRASETRDRSWRLQKLHPLHSLS